MVQLGQKVKDSITGFEGIVTGRTQYLSGCNQALVAPKAAKDGSIREACWFDEQRLIVDKKSKPISLDNGNNPGCDKQAPIR